jgi:hypothetical protein
LNVHIIRHFVVELGLHQRVNPTILHLIAVRIIIGLRVHTLEGILHWNRTSSDRSLRV